MKYLSAYFKNFEGFYAGMNLTELSLDFEKCRNSPFVAIFGENASGKTTLLSSLQPFPGNNDNRSDIIRAGEEGIKRLVIQHDDGHIYKCVIIYPSEGKNGQRPTEKCFLYVLKDNGQMEKENDWINLNPNGGKTSYIEAIGEKLLITKDFFVVGRLGGIKNFIDYGKSQRKSFIANFLPDIEPFLIMHETVTKKYTAMKKIIGTFGDELIKLRPAEECAIALVQLDSQLQECNGQLESLNQEYGAAKSIVDTILNETSNSIPELREFARTGANPLSKTSDDLSKSIKNMEQAILPGETTETLLLKSENADAEVLRASEERARLVTETKGLQQKMVAVSTEKTSLGSKIASMEDKTSLLERLKVAITAKEKEISDLIVEKAKYPGVIYSRFNSMTTAEMDELKKSAMNIRFFLNSQREAFKSAGLPHFASKAEANDYLFKLIASARRLEKSSERISTLEGRIPLLEKNAETEKILFVRPASCKIDTCPFIANAVGCKGSSAELKHIQEDLEAAKKEREEILANDGDSSIKLGFLKTYEENYQKSVATKFSDSKPLQKIPKIYDLVIDFDQYFLLLDAPETKVIEVFDIAHVDDCVNHKTNFAAAKEKLSDLQERLKAISESAKLLDDLKQQLASKNSELVSIENEIAPFKTRLDENEKTIRDNKASSLACKTQVSTISLLAEKRKDLVAVEAKAALMEKYIKDVKEGREKLIQVDAKIKTLKEAIARLNSSKTGISHQIETRKDTEAKLELLQDKFKKIEVVRQATDTTKGIPVHLIEVYLEDIRQKANSLLEIAFKGDFRLGKFIVNETEFAIPVEKSNGSVLDDITLGSGAEISLTKSTLSFAIIQKALGGYNVLYLDEVDGALDATKRRDFVSLLRKQTDELKVEQVFLISHNREFMEEELNMVLLKDHGIETDNEQLMSNKNVVFDYCV